MRRDNANVQVRYGDRILGTYRASAARTARSAQDNCGVFDLALEHGHLVAQDQDLGVLGAAGPGEQGKPAEYPEHREISES
jgi:hypothetical protein